MSKINTPTEWVREVLEAFKKQLAELAPTEQVINLVDENGKKVPWEIVSVEVVEPPDQCGFATNYINLSVGYRPVREIDDIELTHIGLMPDGTHVVGYRKKPKGGHA